MAVACGGRTGANLDTLRMNCDAGISNIHVVWTTGTSYCVESMTAPNYHTEGPGDGILPGSC